MQAMQIPRSTQRGFTLIELMSVLAIVGVLAMFAVPQYRSYLIRTKVVDGLNLAAPAKMAVSESILAKDSVDIDAAKTGYSFTASADIKNVTGISIGASGVITITYGDIGSDASNKTLNLMPTITNNAITWTCRAASVGTPAQPNAGSLPAQYAPENCR